MCIEFIGTVEDGQFFDAVEGSLYLNSCSSAAGTDNDHFLTDVFNAFFFQSLHSADAVCNRAREDAVVVNDSIASADDLGSRGQLVQVLRDRSFVRHGYVPAADFHSAQAFYRIFQCGVVYFKANIYIIEA